MLLQSPTSCRNTVSRFPKWCNHKMLLPVGLGLCLADKPGLGTLLLRPRDSVLLLAPGARRRADLAGVTHMVQWILSPLAAWVPPPAMLSTKTLILTWLRSHHLGVMCTSCRHPLVGQAYPCLLHSPGSLGSHATSAALLRLVQRSDTHTSHPCFASPSRFLFQLKNNSEASV